jgi:hypothetical protein
MVKLMTLDMNSKMHHSENWLSSDRILEEFVISESGKLSIFHSTTLYHAWEKTGSLKGYYINLLYHSSTYFIFYFSCK